MPWEKLCVAKLLLLESFNSAGISWNTFCCCIVGSKILQTKSALVAKNLLFDRLISIFVFFFIFNRNRCFADTLTLKKIIALVQGNGSAPQRKLDKRGHFQPQKVREVLD